MRLLTRDCRERQQARRRGCSAAPLPLSSQPHKRARLRLSRDPSRSTASTTSPVDRGCSSRRGVGALTGRRTMRALLSVLSAWRVYVTVWLLESTLAQERRSNGALDDLEKLDDLLRTYDRRALPTTHLGTPTKVACEIYIRSFGSINPATMDYEVDLYLRQTWQDDRLTSPNVSRPLDLNDPKLVQRIWKPEVFFANAKHAEFQYVTVPNVLVRVNPNGKILYMLRLKLRFACMMDLYRFPMDSQICSIELASFSKTTEELHLEWSESNPIILFEGLKLPQFEIQNINTSICMEKFHIGEYSCLKADFHLQRSLGYHMVQSYLPTVLIVVISWVSFWLDVESIPARTTLGVTTLLTISSKGSGIQSNLPPVSYVKAIDVWMGACTGFVFSALLEFTVVSCLARMQARDKESNMVTTKHGVAIVNAVPENQAPLQCTVRAKVIDQVCRVAFPAIFLVFNSIYWPYFMCFTG